MQSKTQIHTSKPNREITIIINIQNTKKTFCQPSEQLFLSGGHSAIDNEIK